MKSKEGEQEVKVGEQEAKDPSQCEEFIKPMVG
jgi:hypothetical protein